MKYLALVSCVAFLFAASARADEIGNIHQIATLITPQLATEKSQIKIAILLRDQIHRASIQAGAGLPSLTTGDLSKWDDAYRMSVLTRTRANACNGLAILYMLALKSFGIPSRIVTMYAETRVTSLQVASHASVDVLINGKWLAMDPTFNLSLADDYHRPISWREAVERYRAGKIVLQSMDGMTRLQNNPFNYFVAVMNSTFESVSPFALFGPYPGGIFESMNPEWDGKITYIDGSQFDARASVDGAFYRKIAGIDPVTK
jgi:hypothetical protein